MKQQLNNVVFIRNDNRTMLYIYKITIVKFLIGVKILIWVDFLIGVKILIGVEILIKAHFTTLLSAMILNEAI